jgi:4-amino-4-deoxychorismate lyase
MAMIEAGQWLKNGEPLALPWSADRALQFGDGVFETMAANHGQIAFVERHLERLQLGCERLGIKAPLPSPLEEELRKVIPETGPAVVKLIVTAGSGGRGYQRPVPQESVRYIACFPWPEKGPENLSLLRCRLRLSRQPRLAGIKHCNRLEQVLARQEVMEADCDEGLLMDTEGHVIEGVAANIFAVREGRLLTPELDQAGVAGILRARVLEVAAQSGISVRVTAMDLNDILEAEELFMCNSLMGVRPVHRLSSDGQDHHWTTGSITTRLQSEINEWR